MSRQYATDEEQFVLRVPNDVADRIRRVLRNSPEMRPEDANMELSFFGNDADNRTGQLGIGKDRFPVYVQDLPCVVECFKTYDNANLVKSNDIGQVLVVRHPHQNPPEGDESRDGVTKPMKNVRKKFFRPPSEVEPQNIQAVEKALVTILSGGGPRQSGVDVQIIEEWVEEEIDENGQVIADKTEQPNNKLKDPLKITIRAAPKP
mmetsp:Transcript_21131/g.46357  ORF Transcript_21131/g.46357 Transcript_21131/m.46357 type:complete len:205 (-) Transcript_21131:312-926(-)|eukprot:CAMPEP_0118950912 /NCGR_PEP_ID=MMETSP1169-20130426/52214_1 /TAXON_ID=36882 /ORGANISM="Pyramimonas obovata, Strain CCMP722" /LENGTH=204 /DNA_ID=CAMNT_0006897851 /DNA_START=243 /DNA_END=857 /DNA_ORIENTATION=-